MNYKGIMGISLVALLPTAVAPIAQAAAVSPYITKVYEYRPAPGQFVNDAPEYEKGDTEAAMAAKAGEMICGGDIDEGLISLGGFGGYVIFGFDHSIVNVPGEYDFKVYGNAFRADGINTAGSSEPGIVMVSRDENGNGLPDDTWYELAGSEYYKSETKKNFEISYIRPKDGKTAYPDPNNSDIIDMRYVRWTTNDANDANGYIQRNKYHTQPYYPQWIAEDRITFTGTRLAKNATLVNGNYLLSSYAWGYVDNVPNDEESGMKIDWAVNEAGESVKLPSIDFVKVYTAINQICGSIGETSTEVKGAEDLHPDALAVESVMADDAIGVRCYDGTLYISNSSNEEFTAHVIAASGAIVGTMHVARGDNMLDVSALAAGLYVVKTPMKTSKIVIEK